MRTLIAIGSSAIAMALATSSVAADKPKPTEPPKPAPTQAQPPAQAPAAGRYGEPASYRAPGSGQGYTAQSRHMADCLATYPGYDPASDRVVVRPGVTRRCEL